MESNTSSRRVPVGGGGVIAFAITRVVPGIDREIPSSVSLVETMPAVSCACTLFSASSRTTARATSGCASNMSPRSTSVSSRRWLSLATVVNDRELRNSPRLPSRSQHHPATSPPTSNVKCGSGTGAAAAMSAPTDGAVARRVRSSLRTRRPGQRVATTLQTTSHFDADVTIPSRPSAISARTSCSRNAPGAMRPPKPG